MSKTTALPLLKRLADGLTMVRVLLALAMVWVGLTLGRPALDTVAILLILAWATDLLDGPLARRARSNRQTWIGDHDLEADILLSLGLLGYLILGDYVPVLLGFCYVVICVGMFWWLRARQLAMALQAPIYLITICSALRHFPLSGIMLVGWISLTIVVT
jgi:phosphatidylglycerophosphate synthase